MWDRETRKQRRRVKDARRREKSYRPEQERCSSCGADERVEHHEIGSIEGTVPLCRGCAQRAAQAKERDRIAALPKRPALRLVVDNTRDPARVREQASQQPRRARRARGNLT